MIIEGSDGQQINTDEFSDIKAMVYEELATLHAKLKPFGLSFIAAVKYNDKNVVGSISLQKGLDFLDLIQYVDEQLRATTENQFTLSVIKNDDV